jgi:hypothetical protein
LPLLQFSMRIESRVSRKSVSEHLILFYLYLARVAVPVLGTGLTETPEVSGVRSIVHVVLFLTFFYLGFIRKWKSRSIN